MTEDADSYWSSHLHSPRKELDVTEHAHTAGRTERVTLFPEGSGYLGLGKIRQLPPPGDTWQEFILGPVR